MAFERAILLYQQSRYDLAEKELRRELAANPGNARAHGLLAVSLSHQEKYREAVQEARQAIHVGPDDGFSHYALATVFDHQDKFKQAGAAIDEAVRLEPENYYYLGLLSSLHMQQRDWRKGLEAAERALGVNPEYVNGANLRAMALIKLGRRREAANALQLALALAPENPYTRANQGWLMLEEGDPRRAMEHFRESLRIDPELSSAHEGIVEALKARNVFYRLGLRHSFWLSRLDRKEKWGFILSARFFAGVARVLARTPLAPLALPFVFVYLVYVYLSWVGGSLFNLLLRLDPVGRLALSEDQITASNWIGRFALITLLSLILLALTGSPGALVATVWGLMMLIPVSGTFKVKAETRGRKFLAAYTTLLAIVGSFGAGLAFLAFELALVPFGLFVFGAFTFSWVANMVIIRH